MAHKSKPYSTKKTQDTEYEKSLTDFSVRLLVGAEGVEPPTLCL